MQDRQCKLQCGANKALVLNTTDTGLAGSVHCKLATLFASSAQLRVCLMSCMSLTWEGLSSFDLPRAGEMRHIQAHHTAPGSMRPSCHSHQLTGCTYHWGHQRVQGLSCKHRRTAMHIRGIKGLIDSQADGGTEQLRRTASSEAVTITANARNAGSVLIVVDNALVSLSD
jgi:hypothetical protein